ncbi:MAG: hypothetical protein ABI775_12685, partial [Pseudonocardiales bacterium]
MSVPEDSAEAEPGSPPPVETAQAPGQAALPIGLAAGAGHRSMDATALRGALEAVLFVVEAPVSIASLAAAVQQPAEAVLDAVESLRAGYD